MAAKKTAVGTKRTSKAKAPTTAGARAAKKQAALAQKLEDFRVKYLGGRPLTNELRVLLSRELDASLDAYDFSFGLEAGDVALLANTATAPGGAAWSALFDEIAWFGRIQAGSFGYFHGGADTLEGAPVVFFGYGGPLLIAAGPTLLDALLRVDDDDDDIRESLITVSETLGLPPPLSADDRDAELERAPSPEARLAALRKSHPANTAARPLRTAARR